MRPLVVLGSIAATVALLGACGDEDAVGPSDASRNAADVLAGVASFALGLGADLDDPAVVERLAAFDLVVVDGETDPAVVDSLHDAGALVLGYLSVGTIEEGRPWSDAAQAHRLELWPDWGEYYADVADPAFRSILLDDAAPLVLAGGFDGLFLDNVDMVEGHPDQLDGMEALVVALDDLVGDRLLFAQNGDSTIDRFTAQLDGWNREDVTSTGDPLDEDAYERVAAADTAAAVATLERLAADGLLVTATDYVAEGDDATARLAIDRACTAGALPFVSDIGLTRIGDPVSC